MHSTGSLSSLAASWRVLRILTQKSGSASATQTTSIKLHNLQERLVTAVYGPRMESWRRSVQQLGRKTSLWSQIFTSTSMSVQKCHSRSLYKSSPEVLDARSAGQMLPIYSDVRYVNIAELLVALQTQKQPETTGRQSRESASDTECSYRIARTGSQRLSSSRQRWH